MMPLSQQDAILAVDMVPYTPDNHLHFPSVTCRIPPSKLTCLVGPQRSQLRTYLLTLTGVAKPLLGKVDILGQSVSDLDESAWKMLRRRIGYLSGTAPLLSLQSVLMNVMLPQLYHTDAPFRETADKARALLTELGCQFEPTVYPALLNSFQRLQVALARALILDPPVLVLDVPFNNLGARERLKMGVLLGKYLKNRVVLMMGGLQFPHFLEQHGEQIIFVSESQCRAYHSWQSFIETDDPEARELLGLL